MDCAAQHTVLVLPRPIAGLLSDRFVGECELGRWNFKAERSRGLEVKHRLEIAVASVFASNQSTSAKFALVRALSIVWFAEPRPQSLVDEGK
jgi:hypothetical protein